MTTSAMTCESFERQLISYLEGEAADATREAMDRHGRQCTDCGALLAEVRVLRESAAELPELAPSHDLWAGISARIQAPVVPISAALPPVGERRYSARRWLRGTMIAASLAGAVGIGYLSAVARQRPEVAVADSNLLQQGDNASMVAVAPDSIPDIVTGEARAAAGAQTVASSAVSAQLAVATLSADYDFEIGRLRKLVDGRRNQLDPATVAIIEKNLRIIDIAITESKKAVAGDPSSRFLIESLNQSLESKVQLLRIAAALPSRT